MLCEKCGKNNANIMYTQIINGKKGTLNICSSCAAQESIFENFGTLLSFSPREEYTSRVCPTCSTTLAEFTRTGRVGCGECYRTFRKNAESILKKIHGTSNHFPDAETKIEEKKTVEVRKEPKNELEKMREELTKAIETENFEEAAKLRDTIREMEKRGKE